MLAAVKSARARAPRIRVKALLRDFSSTSGSNRHRAELQGAVVLPSPGPPSALQWDACHPTPATPPKSSSTVVVDVHACAVAYRDTIDRSGGFKFVKPGIVPGHEFAGTVTEVAEDSGAERQRVSEVLGTSRPLEVGDRVVSLHWAQDEGWPSPFGGVGGNVPVDSFFGLTCDGGYATQASACASAFVRLPDRCQASRWSAEEAAPVMSTFGTVWQGALERGKLQAGETVAITGASGGVGSAAVTLCKALGCRVIGLTSSQEKAAFVDSLGADATVVVERGGGGGTGAFHRQLRQEVQGGVDMVLECVGTQDTFKSALLSLRPEGRLVLVGNVENSVVGLPLGLAILNSLSIVGSDSVSAAGLERCFNFLDEHGIRPQIERSDPLSRDAAVAAHEDLEARGVRGRIVLQCSEEGW